MGLLREQCAELRKGHLRYCCNQVWTKNGGRIPWNVTVICVIFKISGLMGRHPMRGGSECHLTDQLYRRKNPNFCERLVETTSVWSQSLVRYISRLCIVRGVNLERRHCGRRHWRMEEMDASEIHARSLNAKEVLPPIKGDNFIFPVADGTAKVSGGDQRLRTSTVIRDRPERGEEQEVLREESHGLSSPTPLQDDSTRDDAEAKMMSGLLQEMSFIAIMWTPESNCTCRKKNDFLFHWNISTSTEIPIHH